MLEEATLIAFLFNIFCRRKQWSFLVSKCSFVLVLLTCLVSMIGVPPLSFWYISDCVVVITCSHVWCSSYVYT